MRWLVLTFAALLAAGCAAPARFAVPVSSIADSVTPGPTSDSQASEANKQSSVEMKPEESSVRSSIQYLDPPARTASTVAPVDASSRFSTKASLTVAADNMPLRAFLNYVFTDLLKTNFVVAGDMPGLDQPVTLNAPEQISPRALYRLVTELLQSRNVTVTEKEGVFFVAPADGRTAANIPIGFGRLARDVPDSADKILQIVPLRYGPNTGLDRTIRELLSLNVYVDVAQNAFFITGLRSQIIRALDLVNLLDQPTARSTRVGLINLTYISSRDFIDQIVALLENEGVATGKDRPDGKALSFVSLDHLGSVAVFATGPELLDRVEFWARQLDRPSQGPSLQYFSYQPKFARAVDLGQSLAPLVGAASISSASNRSRDTSSALQALAPGSAATDSSRANQVTAGNVLRRDSSGTGSNGSLESPIAIEGDGVRISIDPRSNSLIFYTTGLRYEALLPMVRRLDVPPKQVVIEATIAEVSLTGDFEYGIEVALTGKKLSGNTQLGLPGGGLSLNYLTVGSLAESLRLRLAATDNQVRILSRPTLVVRDGLEATISVGNDVPTVGATATDPLQSDRTVTSVLYRKTGLKLNIRPTINAEGTLVLDINQEISNAVSGSSGVQGAPIFFERSVKTQVVATSGQSVLLAGLISESGTATSSNVPGFASLPLFGQLFRSDGRRRERTELVLLITPRILETTAQWGGVLDAFGGQLGYLELGSAR
jgi:general secretion pathway protein D